MSQIKVGAMLSYAAVAFNALAGLLYTPWMIRCVGADDYALYTLAISVVNFFLFDFGLSGSVTRFLSKLYTEGKDKQADNLMGVVYKIYFLIAFIVLIAFVVVFLFIDDLYARLTTDQLSVFKSLFLIAATYSVISLPCMAFNGVLTAKEHFIGLNLCNFLQKVFAVGLIVMALLLGYGVIAIVLANAVTSVFFSACKYMIIRRRTKVRAKLRYWNSGDAKDVMGFSGWLALINICARFIFMVMPTILAVVSTTWEITLFGLAASIEGYVYTVASALNNLFLPKVSRIIYGDDDESLQEFAVKVGRIQLYIIGLIIIEFFVMGRLFISCWMGDGYEMLYPCIILLILPEIVELPQLVAVTAVDVSNNVKSRAIVHVLVAFISVSLSSVLGGFMGALGASLAVCVAYLVRTTLMNVVYKKKLGLKIIPFFFEVFRTWLIPAAISVAGGLALVTFIPLAGWLGFFVEAAGMGLLYFAMIWTLSMNNYEKALIKNRKL